jgi:hypothetical protein
MTNDPIATFSRQGATGSILQPRQALQGGFELLQLPHDLAFKWADALWSHQ